MIELNCLGECLQYKFSMEEISATDELLYGMYGRKNDRLIWGGIYEPGLYMIAHRVKDTMELIN
jgi:hypothetical protein